jgi:SAM-dependent methyltransferase
MRKGQKLITVEMADTRPLEEILTEWQLPPGENLLDRVEQMIQPTLLAGYFGSSYTRLVSGLQYHLGGAQDTYELAELCQLDAADQVVDVCCFIGGPAVQLAISYGCKITGIDLDQKAILAAQRIAGVSGLSEGLSFTVGNACALPFRAACFSVVWSQCSLRHELQWLAEVDRVLAPGGRLAFTFQLRGKASKAVGDPFGRWDLDDLTDFFTGRGYSITHAEEITARDMEIGWKALERKLSEGEQVFTATLGAAWVTKARQEFRTEVMKMRAGVWGNGRIVAHKPG